MELIGIIVPILLLITSYLLGSIPFALIISKTFKGIDIREYGSKNMGATNTFRVLGPKYAVIVFVLDALKASIIMLLFTSGLLDYQANWMIIKIHPIIYGLVAVIGHAFPIFADFKGGKGIACSAGIALAFCPGILLIALTIFFIVLLISKYVSISSICALGTAFVCSFFKLNNGKIDWVFVTAVFILWLFIIFLHRKNLVRIVKHEENKMDLLKHLKERKQRKKLENQKK